MATTYPPTTLALDYGKRKIGVAVSQASLAEPLTTFNWQIQSNEDRETKKARYESLLIFLQPIVTQYQVQHLLIGVPAGIYDRQQLIASVVQLRYPEIWHFADQLQQLLALPVTFWNEALSTKQAHTYQFSVGKSVKARRKQDDDHLAAAIFLQDWLDDEV